MQTLSSEVSNLYIPLKHKGNPCSAPDVSQVDVIFNDLAQFPRQIVNEFVSAVMCAGYRVSTGNSVHLKHETA